MHAAKDLQYQLVRLLGDAGADLALTDMVSMSQTYHHYLYILLYGTNCDEYIYIMPIK